MGDIDSIGEAPMRLFVSPPGLMPKALIMQLLWSALIIAILFGVVAVALSGHEKVPFAEAAAPAGLTVVEKLQRPLPVPKQVRVVLSMYPKPQVPVADQTVPPAEPVTATHESVKLDAPEITVLPKPVEPIDDRHELPVRKQRQPKADVDGVHGKLARYCARRGKTNKSWIRVRGVRHYCAL